MFYEVTDFLAPIRQLHEQIREAVVLACEQSSLESMSAIAKDEAGDTIYEIDRISEEQLIRFFTDTIAQHTPIILIAEGLDNGGKMVLPMGTAEAEARWRIIVDPIDGTRGIMYQKRSPWILTGVAPNKGPDTHLGDIVLAVQTEIALIKQHLSDVVWAVKGQGVCAARDSGPCGDRLPPDRKFNSAETVAHGFAMIARFFPGAREILAAIDEEVVQQALGPVQPGKAHCFEDQYICTGGQLFELMAGRDRFNADIRPLMEPLLAERGLALGICCHPYDICTELIARELGVIITDEQGRPLTAPLDVDADVSWVGYANQHIQAQIEPLLQQALRKRGLLEAQ